MEEIQKLVELLKERRQKLIEKTVKIEKIEYKNLRNLYRQAGKFDEEKYCFGDSDPETYAYNVTKGQEDFAIIYENEIIGFVSTWFNSRSAKKTKYMAIALNKDYRGSSIANYALNEVIKYCFEANLDIRTLRAFIHVSNNNSKKLFIHNNFKQIKREKLYMKRNHCLEPLLTYGLKRHVYERNKNHERK